MGVAIAAIAIITAVVTLEVMYRKEVERINNTFDNLLEGSRNCRVNIKKQWGE